MTDNTRAAAQLRGRQMHRRPTAMASWLARSLARACFHSRRSVELAGPRQPRDLGFAVVDARCLGCVPASHPSDLAALGLDAVGLDLQPGSVMPLDVGRATQLDIEAVFQVQAGAAAAGSVAAGAEAPYNCSASAGATGRGLLGPFRLLVLADDGLLEQTAVYFYLVKGADGKLSTHFCQYAFRSSKANNLIKAIYGSFVPVLDGENLSVRILRGATRPSRTGRISCRPASSSTPWRSYTSSPTPTPYSLLSFLEIASII